MQTEKTEHEASTGGSGCLERFVIRILLAVLFLAAAIAIGIGILAAGLGGTVNDPVAFYWIMGTAYAVLVGFGLKGVSC